VERASERRDRFDDEATISELAHLVERRRDELQREALRVAGHLYRKKPRKLGRPVERAGARS
jgi:hypothetical protein